MVISEGTFTVYNGVGHDALSTPVIHYTSPDDLFPGGYIGLATWASLVRQPHRPRQRAAELPQPGHNILNWKQSNGVWMVRAPSRIMSHL